MAALSQNAPVFARNVSGLTPVDGRTDLVRSVEKKSIGKHHQQINKAYCWVNRAADVERVYRG